MTSVPVRTNPELRPSRLFKSMWRYMKRSSSVDVYKRQVFLERIYKYAFVQYKMGMASTYACILFVVLLLFTAVQFWMQKRWVNYDA